MRTKVRFETLLVVGAILVGCGSGSAEQGSASEGGSVPGSGAEGGARAGSSSGPASSGTSSGGSSGTTVGSQSGASGGAAAIDAGASGSDTGAVDSGASDAAVRVTDAASDAPGAPVSVCAFASGLNVPWVKFASDVPNPDLAAFKMIFQNTHDAGGRIVRWWFHTNGTVTPGYDSSGMVLALTQSHVQGVKDILATAHAAGVAVDISLWSFDMLQGGEGISSALRTNNQNLLTVDANRQGYIDKYLTPLVTALKGTPGLYSYEIFNEPEGMTPMGWTKGNGGSEVPESAIQKTVNWFAAAIHTADPAALVTNGAQVFRYCSNASGNTNYYSDAALRAAGGKQNGTLDYYEVHYYASNGTSNSCFLHPASYWALDKELVMGEFFAQATDGVATNDLYTHLFSDGYHGAWAWAYNSDVTWPAMQAPMQNLFNAHMAEVSACP